MMGRSICRRAVEAAAEAQAGAVLRGHFGILGYTVFWLGIYFAVQSPEEQEALVASEHCSAKNLQIVIQKRVGHTVGVFMLLCAAWAVRSHGHLEFTLSVLTHAGLRSGGLHHEGEGPNWTAHRDLARSR